MSAVGGKISVLIMRKSSVIIQELSDCSSDSLMEDDSGGDNLEQEERLH